MGMDALKPGCTDVSMWDFREVLAFLKIRCLSLSCVDNRPSLPGIQR